MASLDDEPRTAQTVISDMIVSQNSYWQLFANDDNSSLMMIFYYKMPEQKEYLDLEEKMNIVASAGDIGELERICNRMSVLHKEMTRKSALQLFKETTFESNKVRR